jgi:regulator of cell morphogenesis and NO signaling
MVPAMTLADLATTHPGASRVFHRYGLDFCCRGRRPLTEACGEKGLDPDAVLADVALEDATTDDPQDWRMRPLSELIPFIVAFYHARLRTELPELVAMAAKVESVHADKATCPRGLAAHLSAIHADVLDHLAKEEQILFPLILSGQGGLAGGPINAMESEHRSHGLNLERTRALTDDLTAPAEACATWQALYLRLDAFEAELMDHIHLENNVLFLRALGA